MRDLLNIVIGYGNERVERRLLINVSSDRSLPKLEARLSEESVFECQKFK